VSSILERIAESKLVVVDDEVDGVAARAAREALVERVRAIARLVGHDGHRRTAILVKGAEPNMLASLRAQRHHLSDHRQKVGGREDTVAIGVVEGASHWRVALRSEPHTKRPKVRNSARSTERTIVARWDDAVPSDAKTGARYDGAKAE
jgi:chaperonin GroEL (HSP60 family)